MIKNKLYSFISGFHFAFIQFSLFLTLQINISSTYITFALVTISWMVGVVAGLWIERFKPMQMIIMQITAFYIVYFLVWYAPFSAITLPLALTGIALSGAWAGRFFIVMLPIIKEANALFFHENNGFIIGTVGFFIGFTMLGRPYLLITPIITTILMLILSQKQSKEKSLTG